MHVTNRFQFRVFADGDGIIVRHGGKSRLQRRQRVQRRSRPHMLIALQYDLTDQVLHRNDGAIESAVVPRTRSARLARDCVLVHIRPAMSIEGSDQIGADSLGRETGMVARPSIAHPRARVRANPRARHAFDAPADRGVRRARHDLSGGIIDRLESRRAETVNLLTRHRPCIARRQHSGARNVAALFSHGLGTSHDDVIDSFSLKAVSIGNRRQHSGAQSDGGKLPQCSIGASAAPRRSDMVVDESVRHLY
jgi:hypothetical protein